MGVWIFGWDRLNKTVHALVATLVALGTKPIRILDSRNQTPSCNIL